MDEQGRKSMNDIGENNKSWTRLVKKLQNHILFSFLFKNQARYIVKETPTRDGGLILHFLKPWWT